MSAGCGGCPVTLWHNMACMKHSAPAAHIPQIECGNELLTSQTAQPSSQAYKKMLLYTTACLTDNANKSASDLSCTKSLQHTPSLHLLAARQCLAAAPPGTAIPVVLLKQAAVPQTFQRLVFQV